MGQSWGKCGNASFQLVTVTAFFLYCEVSTIADFLTSGTHSCSHLKANAFIFTQTLRPLLYLYLWNHLDE